MNQGSTVDMAGDAALASVKLFLLTKSGVYRDAAVCYDGSQNFTVEVPNLVGGLPVGMNSYSNDSPAWGNNAVVPYQEIWVLASSRAASLLARLMAPPRSTPTMPQAGATVLDTVVAIAFGGTGRERMVELRCGNLQGGSRRQLIPADGRTDSISIADPGRPWDIVLIPDGEMAERHEFFGTRDALSGHPLSRHGRHGRQPSPGAAERNRPRFFVSQRERRQHAV